ncbi:MAG: hypothetical protein ABFC67_00720 [Mizugakiibacter sp.]|uniref:hypothetical protein n=1 Tax=Mizugakiibacter sp. TaxID=1972610 RepID=UPI0031BDBFB7|nr:hypothetical protein [Xanthomonadaceae bacterium]
MSIECSLVEDAGHSGIAARRRETPAGGDGRRALGYAVAEASHDPTAGTPMPPIPVSAWLDPDWVRFIEGGVSITVASRDAANVPTLTKGYGCRALDGEHGVRILVVGSHSVELLRDIETGGAVAAVYSEVGTHRALQLKGSGARVEIPDAADRECARHYRESFSRNLAALGFAPGLLAGYFDYADDDLRVVAFVPSEAFLQTPGPRAGSKIGSAP